MQVSFRNFLISLPERGVRSLTAIAGGLVRELGELSIPQTIRRSQLYRNLVEATLRFLIEQVGQVKGVYPGEEKLSEDFLVRRAAGNGIELIGILAFRASPVWVLAALADVSGTGRYLTREITASLKDDGLLDRSAEFTTVDEMLAGLEASSSRLAGTINTPPLDVATLRQEWSAFRRDLSRIPPKQLPRMDSLRELWAGIQQEAQKQHRSVFQVSSLMAMSASHPCTRKGTLVICFRAVCRPEDGSGCGRPFARGLPRHAQSDSQNRIRTLCRSPVPAVPFCCRFPIFTPAPLTHRKTIG